MIQIGRVYRLREDKKEEFATIKNATSKFVFLKDIVQEENFKTQYCVYIHIFSDTKTSNGNLGNIESLSIDQFRYYFEFYK